MSILRNSSDIHKDKQTSYVRITSLNTGPVATSIGAGGLRCSLYYQYFFLLSSAYLYSKTELQYHSHGSKLTYSLTHHSLLQDNISTHSSSSYERSEAGREDGDERGLPSLGNTRTRLNAAFSMQLLYLK